MCAHAEYYFSCIHFIPVIIYVKQKKEDAFIQQGHKKYKKIFLKEYIFFVVVVLCKNIKSVCKYLKTVMCNGV